MKILTVLGTRPQFIKASATSRAIRKHNNVFECLVDTGQHYDKNLSNVFIEELGLPKPKYNLGIGDKTHAKMTALQMLALEDIYLKEKPDVTMVFGDTNSTLSAALTSAKLQIPVAHVESGLRSYNKLMPEEINRILTDHLSDTLFTPTVNAMKNLEKEGISKAKYKFSGDIMLDVLNFVKGEGNIELNISRDINLPKDSYVLLTLHRQENVDNEVVLKQILMSLEILSRSINIIFVVHPRTKKRLNDFKLQSYASSFLKFIDPLTYIEMHHYIKNADMIITDSGGLQKEAYFHSKPCAVIRIETEWTELKEKGHCFLPEKLDVNSILTCFDKSQNISNHKKSDIFGLGNAATTIIETLIKKYA